MSASVNSPAEWPWASTARGVRYSNLENVTLAFERDTSLQGLVWFDAFLNRLQTGAQAREWTDDDDVRLCVLLQRDYHLKSITAGMVRQVVEARARAFPRHVVREWLGGLVWDGLPRLESALTDYWGATPTDEQPVDYLEAASRNFLIGLVARVLRPGCKLDTMPVFEGQQGIYKSSALGVLVGDAWHTTAHESVTSKDFFQALSGKWLVEIAELDSFSRAEVNRVKSVMSTATDRYRASYGRTAADHPRQCVFAGTTNSDNWGRDESGLRRFWPITCGRIDLARLEDARPQLFAEAVARFRGGEGWWAMPSSTAAVQAARQQESAIADAIHPWLLSRSECTIFEILTGPMKLEPGRIGKGHEMEVARVLKLAGWEKKNRRRNGEQVKLWVVPESDTATTHATASE